MIKFRNNRNETPGRKAFTLIEMLVVVCILMILISLVIAVSRYVMVESARKKTVAIEAILISATNAFYDDNKSYPPTATDGTQSISALYGPLKADTRPNGPFDKMKSLPSDVVFDGTQTINDAWGKALRYDASGGLGGGPVIISAGPDGVFGTTDDIRSDSAK